MFVVLGFFFLLLGCLGFGFGFFLGGEGSGFFVCLFCFWFGFVGWFCGGGGGFCCLLFFFFLSLFIPESSVFSYRT